MAVGRPKRFYWDQEGTEERPPRDWCWLVAPLGRLIWQYYLQTLSTWASHPLRYLTIYSASGKYFSAYRNIFRIYYLYYTKHFQISRLYWQSLKQIWICIKKITSYLLQAYKYFVKIIEMFEQADIKWNELWHLLYMYYSCCKSTKFWLSVRLQ